jgi:hypothetical protein
MREFVMFWQPSILANSGTPLMWAGMLHLFFGNILIGIGEGLVLSRLFKTRGWRSVGLMILANFISAWLGGLLLSYYVPSLRLPIDLNNGQVWIWLMVFAMYIITLIMEWPFIFLCFPKEPRRLKRSVLANSIVQSLSYLLIFGWYGMASQASLYKGTSIRPYSEFLTNRNAVLYYIDDMDGDVYQLHLCDNKKEKIYILNSQNKNNRLFVRQSSGKQEWDLIARTALDETEKTQEMLIRKNIPGIFAEFKHPNQPENDKNDYESGTWFNFNRVSDLRPKDHRQWLFIGGFWAIEGLKVYNDNTQERIYLSLETPFIQWMVRNITVLPGDQAVFQLGENQICLFDRETRRLGLIVKGRGAVVGLSE